MRTYQLSILDIGSFITPSSCKDSYYPWSYVNKRWRVGSLVIKKVRELVYVFHMLFIDDWRKICIINRGMYLKK